jgi:hypothetical protein
MRPRATLHAHNEPRTTTLGRRRRQFLLGLGRAAAAPLLVHQADAESEAVIGLSNGYFGTEWRN